jgi:two-component system OmpR family response regulator
MDSSIPLSGAQTNLAVSASEELLDHVKIVAHQITERVRLVLGRTDAEPSRQAEHYPARDLRALCVDDNVDAADSLAAILELLGCESRACYDGPSALIFVREFSPDACFLDLSMPGMDGLQLAAQIRAGAGSHALLLVAVTALGSLETRTHTALAGFHYHFIKPVDSAILRPALDRFRIMLDHPARQPPVEPPSDESNSDK